MMPIAKIPRGRASAKLGRRPTGTTARGGSWRASAKARGGERTIHARTGGYGGRCCSTRDDEISGLMSGEFDRTIRGARLGARAAFPPARSRLGRHNEARMAFAASAAIRAAARTPSISFPVRRMPDGTRVSDLPVGASRCAALPARAPRKYRPRRIQQRPPRAPSDASTSPSFPARSRSSHSRGVRVPTERRRRGFGRGRGREVVHDVPPATSAHPLPPTGTPSAGLERGGDGGCDVGRGHGLKTRRSASDGNRRAEARRRTRVRGRPRRGVPHATSGRMRRSVQCLPEIIDYESISYARRKAKDDVCDIVTPSRDVAPPRCAPRWRSCGRPPRPRARSRRRRRATAPRPAAPSSRLVLDAPSRRARRHPPATPRPWIPPRTCPWRSARSSSSASARTRTAGRARTRTPRA